MGPSTSTVIDALIVAIEGDAADARRQYILRQALQGLVRQARAEQMLEMRRHVERAAGKGSLARARLRADLQGWSPQQELEFGRREPGA